GAADVSDAGTGSVTFAQGETTKTITININDDLVGESKGTVSGHLPNPSGSVVNPTIGTAAATTTILDNDNATSISIAHDAVSVDEAAGTMTFTVTRTGDAQGTQTVPTPRSANLGAADVSDAGTGSVTFAQGETTKTITININDDLLDETNETAKDHTSKLHSQSNNLCSRTPAATTTILDNDNATSISIAHDAVSVDEAAATMTFTVTRTDDAQGTQTVHSFPTRRSSDLDVSDAGTGSVTFAQGETTKTITININDDLLDETNE